MAAGVAATVAGDIIAPSAGVTVFATDEGGTLHISEDATLTGFSDVNSWYNSFVASIEKPFDHGLELLINYTWAKAYDRDASRFFKGHDFTGMNRLTRA